MKIAVYSMKGGAGKTPIATNIVFDREYALITNEYSNVFGTISTIDEERLLTVPMEDEIPSIPADVDAVFDLAGSISQSARSISSAMEQCDCIIVPIYDELKSIQAGINTLAELVPLGKPVLVVATKLEKGKKEIFTDWRESESFLNIQNFVHAKFGPNIQVVPLKKSKVFDTIFESELSIAQMRERNKLDHYTYREVGEQFEAIYSFINSIS